MTISLPPPQPSLNSAEFNDQVLAFFSWFQTSIPQFNDLAGGTGVANFIYRDDASAATIGADIDYIRTFAKSSASPASFAIYKRASAASTGSFLSADGTHWVPAWTRTELEMFGAVGDGTTDDQSAWGLAVALGLPIYLTRTYLVTNPGNTLGVPISGPGKLVTAVDGGKLQYNIPSFNSPVQFRHFGYAAKNAIIAQTPLKVVIFGDSTATNNYGIDIGELVSDQLENIGVGVSEVINEAVGSTSWSTRDYSLTLNGYAEQKHLAIIKFGINEAGAPPIALESAATTLRNSMRTRLDQIRSSTYGSAQNLSILLIMPNALGNNSTSTTNKNNLWLEATQQIHWEAARDYECMIYNPYTESRWASGQENKSLDGFLIHPQANHNLDIWGRAVEETLAPFASSPRNRFVLRRFSEGGSRLSSEALQSYPRGLTVERASNGDGWPITGFVTTMRHPDTIGWQQLDSFQSGYSQSFKRHWINSSSMWSTWSGNSSAVDLTLLNSWVAWGGALEAPKARRSSDGLVVLSGSMKNGTVTNGTDIFQLPTGYSPVGEGYYIASRINGLDTTRLLIKSNGFCSIAANADANLLGLNGITFYSNL